MSFSTSVAARTKAQLDAVIRIRKAAILDLCGSTIAATPVLTGLLQGNWQSSLGSPREGELNIRPMNMAIAESVAAVSEMKGDEVFYFRNNCPHAWPCEMGWSKKAPVGMLRRNVARVNQIIKRACKGGAL